MTTVPDLLRAFFPDYLRLTEPDWAEELDFGSLTFPWDGHSWNDSGEPGIAAQVSTRGGERITVLVRIAETALPEKEVGRWLGRQARKLELRLADPVLVSVVVLRGGVPGSAPPRWTTTAANSSWTASPFIAVRLRPDPRPNPDLPQDRRDPACRAHRAGAALPAPIDG